VEVRQVESVFWVVASFEISPNFFTVDASGGKTCAAYTTA